MKFVTKLLLVLSLAMGAAMIAPAANAQSSERLPMERLDRDVQQILMRALRSAGVETGSGMTVMVGTSDCPSNCNNNVLGGKCYCAAGTDGCPSGTDTVRGGTGNRQCSVNPTTAAVVGGPLREPGRFNLR